MLQEFDILLKEIDSIKLRDYALVSKCKSKAKSLVRRLIPSSSHTDFKKEIDDISFSPMMTYAGQPESEWNEVFTEGIVHLKGIVENIRDEYAILQKIKNNQHENKNRNQNFKDVFLVHGHNEEILQSVARFLEKLDLNPVIMREKSDKGRTIIEKFEDESDVNFAIVLLSGDDLFIKVADKKLKEPPIISRARQNVILELGYFIGRFGRNNIIALYKSTDGFEFPSDISGVVYKPYTSGWELDVAKELSDFGFNIDFNKLK